jgi:hypothetical protein
MGQAAGLIDLFCHEIHGKHVKIDGQITARAYRASDEFFALFVSFRGVRG